MEDRSRKIPKRETFRLKLNEWTSKMSQFLTFLPIKNNQWCNWFLKNILIMENGLQFFLEVFRKATALFVELSKLFQSLFRFACNFHGSINPAIWFKKDFFLRIDKFSMQFVTIKLVYQNQYNRHNLECQYLFHTRSVSTFKGLYVEQLVWALIFYRIWVCMHQGWESNFYNIW